MAQSPINLGTADNFAVLAGTTITNTGPSVITGDIGVYPGSAITGFPPGTVTGTIHAADAVALQAQNDLTAAYNDAAGRTPATTVAFGVLGGLTLGPGVYKSASSLGLTGILTLDAHGDPNAVFIFQMGSTLTTASSSNVNLINGAQACNVFWQVGSSATLGTNSSFKGDILALTSITATTGVTVEGRLLARNGAVTLDTNHITRTICAFLSLTKVCLTPTPPSTHFTVGNIVSTTLTVTNSGSTDATGVTVVDQLFIPADVQIGSLTTNPLATLISPPTGPYSNTNIIITWTGLTVPALSSLVLTVTFTILAAPPLGDVITNVDAGIGVLSGTNQFTCTIPVSTGVFLSLTKVCPIPTPPNNNFTIGDTVTTTLTVTNSDSTNATGVTVVDQLLIPADVQISSLTTNPSATLISPATGPYSNTNIFITWTGLTVPALSSIVLTVTFTILAAPPQGDVITNVDAGIGVLSGTNQFTCTIPVISFSPIPQRRRGIPLW